jgi:hypothetical protein
MKTNQQIERIVEGDLLAEVEVQLMDDDLPGSGWGPYFSVSDVRKLEIVKAALKAGNVAEASKFARVYRLLPVTAA